MMEVFLVLISTFIIVFLIYYAYDIPINSKKDAMRFREWWSKRNSWKDSK